MMRLAAGTMLAAVLTSFGVALAGPAVADPYGATAATVTVSSIETPAVTPVRI